MTSSQHASTSPAALPDSRRWLDWLRKNTDRNWRPGQWNHDAWLFTAPAADPTVTVSLCQVKNCGKRCASRRFCKTCARAFRQSGLSLDEFIATYAKVRSKESPALYAGRSQCCAKRLNVNCPRIAMYSGLCQYHYYKWKYDERRDPSLTLHSWLTSGTFKIPVADHPDCLVRGCGRESRSTRVSLCFLHHRRYKSSGATADFAAWAKTQAPHIADHQFTLIHLDEELRWEVLYALQQRDARGGRIDPLATRAAINVLREYPSLTRISQLELDRITEVSRESNANGHLVEFARSLRKAHDEITGRTPKDRLFWDLVEVGLKRDPTPIGGRRRRAGLDFGLITQSWLRELTMEWARDATSLHSVTEAHRVMVMASAALEQQPHGATDPDTLTYRDAEVIIDAINRAERLDGKPYRASYKRHLYRRFFEVIEYGRLHGYLDQTPMSFGRRRSHVIPDDRVEESTGKAIPIDIQRQLDANIDTIGRGVHYGTLNDEQRQRMFATAYILLRDTGRRTAEIASLQADCLARDPNGPIMIYDNHKAGRLRRRLPILESTADAIQRWLSIRTNLATHSDYLFPGEKPWEDRMDTKHISRALRAWVDSLDRLDANELNKDGHPVPSDRMRIFPYAFRHSYAQRHADNGTPIDVLRELLDHKTIQTTSCYYVVTGDRKRQAINTVGKYSIDRTGAPTILTDSTSYQMRSVAVPFGNCIEPTNVKAGGHGCPIRFQCAGCGFYRPDPSYIPAIEEHINSLRADREIATAMDTASFVIDNLTAEITAFEHILSTLRDQLDRLEGAERARVEEASTALRKVRAGTPLPLTAVNHRQQETL